MSESTNGGSAGDFTPGQYERAASLADGLFPHQVDGVAFLLGRKRAILADDMGLGKTRQAIVALREAVPSGPYLVVCPASVKRNWEREVRMVAPDAAVSVLGGKAAAGAPSQWTVVNYDILAAHIDALEAIEWAGIIFDEAHYLKNHTSRRSRMAMRLACRPGAADCVVYALTGTPLTNRPRDLFPLLQLMQHAMGRSFLSFARRYCDATHNGFGWVTDGASNLAELSQQLHGVMLRRAKEAVLYLPPKLRAWLDAEVPEGTAAAEMRGVVLQLMANQAREASGARAGRGQNVERARLLAGITKARRKIAVAKVASTLDFIDGAVAQGEKVVVFSCFDESIRKIAAHFGEQAVLLTGATPAAQRQDLVDRFQQDPSVRVFAANIVAGGVGITLTAARQVVFNDLDWVPANHWQAEDRAYRIGQTQTVNVTYMVAGGTIDDFVQSVLTTKAAVVGAVVEARPEELEGAGDVLAELQRLLRQISPQLADFDTEQLDEEAVAGLIRDLARRSREQNAFSEGGTATASVPHDALEKALQALARALGGPKTNRYRITSRSDAAKSYELTVEISGDVTCGCRGFEYRGMCAHARELKAALATGAPLPAAYEPVG